MSGHRHGEAVNTVLHHYLYAEAPKAHGIFLYNFSQGSVLCIRSDEIFRLVVSHPSSVVMNIRNQVQSTLLLFYLYSMMHF